MIELDPGSDESRFSERLADLLRPGIDELLGFEGIDLIELTVSPLVLDDILLMSCGDDVLISIVGKSMGCKA